MNRNETVEHYDKDEGWVVTTQCGTCFEYEVDFCDLESYMRSQDQLTEMERIPNGFDWDQFYEKYTDISLDEYEEKYGLEDAILEFIEHKCLTPKILEE
jgi:hypothetical protein